MNLLRRYALGGPLAAFVYFAIACAKGTEEPDIGGDADGGSSSDARSEATVPRDSGGNRDSSSDAPTTGGNDCTALVVINELMSDGTTSAADEFVELYNPGSSAVSLSGWKLAYRAANGNPGVVLHTFATGAQIPADGYFVLGGTAFVGKTDGALSGSMAAAGGQIALLDENDGVIDGVAYGAVDTGATAGTYAEGSPADAPEKGGSISRTPNCQDTDDNSADFVKTKPHSAGAAN